MRVERLPVAEEEGWLRMRRALWPDCPEPIHRHEMTLLRRETGAVFAVRRPNGELGGFAEVSVRHYAEGCHGGLVGYLEGWYVEPELRGGGAGRALLAAAEAWAQGQGCLEMASDTEVENVGAQAAHRRVGYQDVGALVHFRKPLR
jgi:aminoglycoside 6'-N-acetyltransferase I